MKLPILQLSKSGYLSISNIKSYNLSFTEPGHMLASTSVSMASEWTFGEQMTIFLCNSKLILILVLAMNMIFKKHRMYGIGFINELRLRNGVTHTFNMKKVKYFD